MICGYCFTTLPPGALFCGECGRAVATQAETAKSVIPQPPPPRERLTQQDTDRQAAPRLPKSSSRCQQCGADLDADDIFCGECGFVVAAGTGTGTLSRQRETPVVDGPDRPEPEPERAAPLPVLGERFVLQFSTGETFMVYGNGLVGRNPRAEPGEYFDQLVRVVDASRSVSKTHLEFGQDAGEFWIKDRFSGNGTIVREPDSPPMRCHPERRYRLARGSRVDMGEQFFIVS